jgi:hypothetical protein
MKAITFAAGLSDRGRSLRASFVFAGTLAACLITSGSNPAQASTITVDGNTASCSSVTHTCTVTMCNGKSVTSPITFSQLITPVTALIRACSGGNASVGQAVQQATSVGLDAVQTQNQFIRDQIQDQMTAGSAAQPLAYASVQDQFTDSSDLPWAALAYADDEKSPIVKALHIVPPATDPPAVQWSAWGQGFGDFEQRTGVFDAMDIGRTTTTGGGIGGVYAIIRNLSSASDVLVLGAFGSGMGSYEHNDDGTTANISGGGFGFNGIYINGGFSNDTTVKVDFLDVNASTAGFTGLSPTNVAVSDNLNYKIRFSQGWVEPIVGASYSNLNWNGTATALGLSHGDDVRVQGGLRIGSSWDWNGVRVAPVVAIYAYDDVLIRGGTLATVLGVPLAPTDEGKVFIRANTRLGFDWGQGWSSYIEGEIRGRGDVFGAALRGSLTYAFGTAAPVIAKY